MLENIRKFFEEVFVSNLHIKGVGVQNGSDSVGVEVGSWFVLGDIGNKSANSKGKVRCRLARKEDYA